MGGRSKFQALNRKSRSKFGIKRSKRSVDYFFHFNPLQGGFQRIRLAAKLVSDRLLLCQAGDLCCCYWQAAVFY